MHEETRSDAIFRAFSMDGVVGMVYRAKTVQLSIESFGQGLGVSLSPDNKWVPLADRLPWTQLEDVYRKVFPSPLGRAGKPFRLLYGAQLIKQSTGLSDVDLVNAIRARRISTSWGVPRIRSNGHSTRPPSRIFGNGSRPSVLSCA